MLTFRQPERKSSEPSERLYIWLTTTFHLTLIVTSAQVVETSVTIADNSPSQDYTHPDDQTTLLHILILLSNK